MPKRSITPDRIHLLAHANPASKDVVRFEYRNLAAYLDAIRAALPNSLRLTYNRSLFEAVEHPEKGGRRDDALRARDINDALRDPQTRVILAVAGGGYFSRILPHLDFSPLAARRTPLWAMGFSEMSTLVNLIACYRCGRGVYWLCPNYLAWKIKPPAEARTAFGRFWSEVLPEMVGCVGHRAGDLKRSKETKPASPAEPKATDLLHESRRPLRTKIVAGSVRPGLVRFVGGCLTVFTAALAGPMRARVRPDGKWLAIEDVNEAPYRVDRALATLKLEGWFDRLAGVLVGDFHTGPDLQTDAVVELLRYHLPSRRIPILTTRDLGHVWPMPPLILNRPLRMTKVGRTEVSITNQPIAR